MNITIFGLLVAALGIWCQFKDYRATLLAMFGLSVFGAVAALELSALGGASVTPANFFLLFYGLRIVSMRQGTGALIAEIGPRRPLFIYLLLVLWILASAILLPRLFDGATDVFSLSRSDTDSGTTPLHPTSGNISQAVYALGGFVVASVTSAFVRRPGAFETVIKAVVLVTSLHLAFAVLDVVTAATHTGFILDLIHTASYTFLTDDELGGLKRISGSFSEASAFAGFSLTLLAVNFVLFIKNVRPRFTGIASLMLTAFIGLSTSSAGYAGLVVFFAGFFAYATVATLFGRRKRVAMIALTTVCAGLFLVSFVILFLPSVSNVAQQVVTESLLNKGTTDSALERGSWNAQALAVFEATHWLGAGIGATRASNYALVLLSNLGIIGFALFVLLLLRITFARMQPGLGHDATAMVWAARVGAWTTIVPALLVGTVYDLGTLFCCLIGIAASAARVTAPAPSPVRQDARHDRLTVPSAAGSR